MLPLRIKGDRWGCLSQGGGTLERMSIKNTCLVSLSSLHTLSLAFTFSFSCFKSQLNFIIRLRSFFCHLFTVVFWVSILLSFLDALHPFVSNWSPDCSYFSLALFLPLPGLISLLSSSSLSWILKRLFTGSFRSPFSGSHSVSLVSHFRLPLSLSLSHGLFWCCFLTSHSFSSTERNVSYTLTFICFLLVLFLDVLFVTLPRFLLTHVHRLCKEPSAVSLATHSLYYL